MRNALLTMKRNGNGGQKAAPPDGRDCCEGCPVVKILTIVFLCLLALGAASGRPSRAQSTAESSAAYVTRTVEGWTVHVSRELLTDKKALGDEALRLLEVKLVDARRALPVKALEMLRKTPIWVEADSPRWPGAVYHPSREWLRENGFNPDKARAIEIGNAANFLKWTAEQPLMLIHEMAHAYHHQVLGYGHPGIMAAYKNAIDRKLYEAVLRYDGRTVKAYAANNEQEYFAELTEAYFGTNDFYPFVRAELMKHDPEGYRLLRSVWANEPESR